jgi:hypothetical protein
MIVNLATSKICHERVFTQRSGDRYTLICPVGKTDRLIIYHQIGDGIQVHLMHDLSQQLSVILIIIW